MKKIKLFGIVSLLMVILPLNVFANTFTNNNKEYKITKADAACTQLTYVSNSTDATVLYVDATEKKVWSLHSDNICREITIENLIENQDKYVYISYNADFKDDKTIDIYRTKEYQFINQALIKSTVYDSTKQYYTNDSGVVNEVETNNEADLDKYYEYAFFKPALYDATTTKTYYTTVNSGYLFEIVENPETAEVGTLYVISDHENVVFDKVKSLDDKLLTALEQNTPQYVEVIATPTENAFYFLAHMDNTGNNINVYDENGNLLYEGVTSFTTALDELHVVYKDNKSYIYDLNKKLLHETAVITSPVYEWAQSSNASLLSQRNTDIYFITTELMSEPTTNPNTSDGIITTIIITIITGLSLVGLITFQTKIKRKN